MGGWVGGWVGGQVIDWLVGFNVFQRMCEK